uniref:Flavodoxin-like domain-containing protein n=1 Tax=Astyanax mexicanus TaxID=7994 RepID=A0A8B9GZ40_ASTMX
MEDTNVQSVPSDQEEELESLFSSVDIFFFSLISGLLIYWFLSRRRPPPVPEIRTYMMTCILSELPRLTEVVNSLAVFCMATYGEGEPTDNAQGFYDWMQVTDVSLEGVHFSVFGLGNKTYDHYNAMGKYTDRRLAELGATQIFDLGLGDDDGNLEEDFISWKAQFWPAVCAFFGVQPTQEECRYPCLLIFTICFHSVT